MSHVSSYCATQITAGDRSSDAALTAALIRLAEIELQHIAIESRGGPSIDGRISLGDGAYRRLAPAAP